MSAQPKERQGTGEPLTAMEARVVAVLQAHAPEPVQRGRLASMVFGAALPREQHACTTHIHNIRGKLGSACIGVQHGSGYYWRGTDAEVAVSERKAREDRSNPDDVLVGTVRWRKQVALVGHMALLEVLGREQPLAVWLRQTEWHVLHFHHSLRSAADYIATYTGASELYEAVMAVGEPRERERVAS